MEKFKSFFKIVATNKMMWITLVVGILIIVGTTATVCAISYMKTRETLADADIEDSENIIKQEELIDTSKMSEEELKKLNEEEQKKLEKKKKEEKKKNNTTTSKPVNYPYYIKVNYGAQTVTVYGKDKNGKYTVPVRAMICSTGAATPTSGVYRIGYKWTWGLLYGNVWGHYSCQVVGDILFHSVPYNKAKNDTLVSKYYDRLGSKDSMGCIRLTTIDAQWIFYNCPSGTQVEFYSSSNPGPLGKPTARKVSNMPGNLKNWDPTDPDSRNPWIAYLKKEQENNKKPTNNNTTTNSENQTNNNTTTNSENQTNNNTTTNSENQTNNNTTTNTENPGGNTNTETNTPSTNPTEPTTPTKPETPDNPVEPKPEDPTKPETPDKPVEPKPENPITPTKPESDKPENPITPSEPEQPTNPTTPEDPTTPTESDKPADQETQSGSERPTEPEKNNR